MLTHEEWHPNWHNSGCWLPHGITGDELVREGGAVPPPEEVENSDWTSMSLGRQVCGQTAGISRYVALPVSSRSLSRESWFENS